MAAIAQGNKGMLQKVAEQAPAGLAISSPWWLPDVHHVSMVAADWLPIFGCLWLVVQIVGYIYKRGKKNVDDAS